MEIKKVCGHCGSENISIYDDEYHTYGCTVTLYEQYFCNECERMGQFIYDCELIQNMLYEE